MVEEFELSCGFLADDPFFAVDFYLHIIDGRVDPHVGDPEKRLRPKRCCWKDTVPRPKLYYSVFVEIRLNVAHRVVLAHRILVSWAPTHWMRSLHNQPLFAKRPELPRNEPGIHPVNRCELAPPIDRVSHLLHAHL